MFWRIGTGAGKDGGAAVEKYVGKERREDAATKRRIVHYLRARALPILAACGMLLFLNLYLGVFCATQLYGADLVYLNLLLAGIAGAALVVDLHRWRKLGKRICFGRALTSEEEEHFFGSRAGEYIQRERAEQELELSRRVEELEELSDYIARWSHEAKLPLAALRLMNERNTDTALQREMQDCIVRLESQVHAVMMGSKLQRPEHDVHFKKLLLSDVVRESVKNRSWEMIQAGMEVKLELGENWVYSDQRWLVYLLDQLIANAIKYRKGGEEPAKQSFGAVTEAAEQSLGAEAESPKLSFCAVAEPDGDVCLSVEDNGIGISPEDLPCIFERGYVGKALRSGDYRSTGMGLYFVKKTAGLLHIQVEAFSEEGKGTRFALRFCDLTDYLMDV